MELQELTLAKRLLGVQSAWFSESSLGSEMTPCLILSSKLCLDFAMWSP